MGAAEVAEVVAVHRQARVVHRQALVLTAVWAMLRVVQADVRTMVLATHQLNQTGVLTTASSVRGTRVQTCERLMTICAIIPVFRMRCTPTPTIYATATRLHSRQIPI